MRTAVRLLVVCLLSVVLVVAPVTYREAEAQSGWTLYDNFNSLLIDPTKWVGGEEIDPTLPPPQGALEIFRALVAGELTMYNRVIGNPVDGNIIFHNIRLGVRYPDSVRAMQAKVNVRRHQLTECPQALGGSGVQVRLNGIWFNTATPTPGSFENDVVARIDIYRSEPSSDPPGVFRVRARVFRYLDPAGFNWEFAGNLDLGTVNVGQSTIYSIRWDESTARFYFRMGANLEVYIAYPWTPNSAASMPRK
ncbi:MAG TPA: hypothetical protein VIV15_15220, partial [Anaerolineales bacterium]